MKIVDKKILEIYLSDLTPEAQLVVKEFYGFRNDEDGNFAESPIVSIPMLDTPCPLARGARLIAKNSLYGVSGTLGKNGGVQNDVDR